MELIRIEDIHKTYHLGEVDVPVLRGISLSIARGEMVALMGASGSGKTTLDEHPGLPGPSHFGQVLVRRPGDERLTPNQRALVRTEKLGFVFQSFNLLARTTALQNVIMPLDYAAASASSGGSPPVGQCLLDRVGLADRLEHEPSQMSGGQQQRVAIARSLVNQPALVLADEPTGNLDSHTSVEILRMFQQLNAEGITVVLVTHDPKVAAYAHRTIRIADGLIEGDEPAAPHTTSRRHSARSRLACRRAADGLPATAAQTAAAGGGVRHALERCRRIGDVPPARAEAAESRRAMCRIAGRRPPVRSRRTLRRPAAEQDAVGPDGPGRDHRRRRRDRHDGDRPRLEGRHAENHRQHGRQQPPGPCRARPPAAASASAPAARMTLTPQDADEIARAMSRRQRRRPDRARPLPGRLRQPQLDPHAHLRHHALVLWRSATGRSMDEGDMFTDRDVRNRSKVCVIGKTLCRELFQDESPWARTSASRTSPSA